MGNQLSNTISGEKFRDQIFSLVLYYVAPKANLNLKYVSREKCNNDNLPIPDDPDLAKLLNFYNINDMMVDGYIKANILNTDENLIRFYQTLINLLKVPSDTTEDIFSKNITNFQSNRLTRSHLNKIESRQSSHLGGQLLPPLNHHKMPSLPRSDHKSLDRSDKPSSGGHPGNKFTQMKIADHPNDFQTASKKTNIDDNNSLDIMKQKLMTRLMNTEPNKPIRNDSQNNSQNSQNSQNSRNSQLPDEEEDVAHDSQVDDDQVDDDQNDDDQNEEEINEEEINEEEINSKEEINNQRKNLRNKNTDLESNTNTLKYKKRFKEKCIIQEDI